MARESKIGMAFSGLLKQTTVRQNLSANLVSKVLSALISFACVPIYLRVLGASGYGLIGVWMMLSTLANLLDLGVSPTVTRELAASRARGEGAQVARDLVRTLELGYWLVGILIGAAIVGAAPLIAGHWLQSSQLSTPDIHSALVLIGILVLCRWPLSFYSGGLTGLERQVLLSWTTLAFAVVGSVGAVVVLIFVSPTIIAFFLWQIAVSLAQTAAIAVLLWRCLPAAGRPRLRLELVRRIWKFAGGVTGVALVSMLLTDLDKLVVSRMLSLEAFGYYSLAWRIASSLYVISSPVFVSLFPAFSRFVAARNEDELATLYHRGAQLISALVVPAAVTVVFFARPLIFAWTGSIDTANQTWLIAALLTAGTAFNCVVVVPYALQLAHGWTTLAFWTNFAYVFVTIPLLFLLTKAFGGEGAAGVWLVINASYLATQVPLMHRRLLRREVWQWYIEDLGMPLFTSVTVAAVVASIVDMPQTRVGGGLVSVLAGTLVAIVAVFATPFARRQVLGFFTPRLMRPMS